MATYKVKAGDSPLTLAEMFGVSPQKILQSNGIKSLTQGQTLKIPNFGQAGGGLGLSQPNAMQLLTGNYNVANTLPQGAVGYAGVSGSNEPYRGQPIGVQSATLENARIMGGGAQKVNPSLVRTGFSGAGGGISTFNEPLPIINQSLGASGGSMGYGGFQTPTTNGFTSGQGAMALGQNRHIPPNTGIPQGVGSSNTTSSTANTSLPAGYVYGSNPELDAVQRRVWNIQAGGTGDEQVRPLSRDQIWNMKADQRRRRNAEKAFDQARLQQTQSTPTGNAVNQSLQWRAG